ncbi:MAG: tagatose-6-phosphate kinase [Candidatus Sericytochromatia bacterium]|nr:MAG: tagatose-6-phosphate kinase [Candidatus Sericytochromatia bacterium]
MTFLTVTLNASIDRTTFINGFNINKINRSDTPIESAGGKGLNVARVLNILEKDVLATGFIGGYYGEKLKYLMEKDNIKNDFYQIKGETRFCLAIVDKKNNTLTEINENGPNISKEEFEDFLKKLKFISKGKKFIILSGSVPTSLPEDTYFQIINYLKDLNIPCILDASRKYLKKAIQSKPFLIKPNHVEAQDLLGYELNTIDNILKALNDIKNFCEMAVITYQDKGSFIYYQNNILQFIPPKVNIVNTVGSGDAFLAGLVAKLEENKDLEEIGKFATACGTANALTQRAGYLKKEDLFTIYKNVKVIKF